MSQIGQKLRVDFVETATPEIGQNLRQILKVTDSNVAVTLMIDQNFRTSFNEVTDLSKITKKFKRNCNVIAKSDIDQRLQQTLKVAATS